MEENQIKLYKKPYQYQRHIHLNPYKNPYLTKLSMKLIPNYSQIAKTKLINPLSIKNKIQLYQVLPLFKNQRTKFCLLWQQHVKNSFNKTQMGFQIEYKKNKNFKIVSKNLGGSLSIMSTTSLYKAQKIYGHTLMLSCLYSADIESVKQIYHTVGVGASLNNISISLQKRIQQQQTLQISYHKNLMNNKNIGIKYCTQLRQISSGQSTIGLGYRITQSLSTWVNIKLQTNKSKPTFAVQLQWGKLDSIHCLVACIQFTDEKSILYLGYKCSTFDLIIPIIGSNSVIPALIGLGLFIFGYFMKSQQKYAKKTQNLSEKDRLQKIKQLKFITQKSNENYKKQQQSNGLLIQQVFIGQKQLLKKFIKQPNKYFLLTNPSIYKQQIFDGTVVFRFYVQKGQLLLSSGNKLSMIGLRYNPIDNKSISIYIRYIKNGQESSKEFSVQQPIKL